MNLPALAELFGSADRFKALRVLFSEPGRGFGQRELARSAGIDPGHVSRLLKRWLNVGLVQRVEADGLPRYFATNDPAFAPLVALMQQDSELVRILRDFLGGVEGIQAALIFGSFARGEASAESDIDVLALGNLSELKLNTLARPIGRKLGRPVRVSAMSVDNFREQVRSGEGFAVGIVHGPRIPLIGDLDATVVQATER
jgi:predicted nucleotidyltransferase